MDKDTINLIVNMLRQGTLQWPGRKAALKAGRKKVLEGYTAKGKPAYKYFWQCAKCSDWMRDSSAIEVDHIVEIGSFNGDWNEYINRMYCPSENLQLLCVKCHAAKTTMNARERWTRKQASE